MRLVGEAEALELLEIGAGLSGATLKAAAPVTGLSAWLVTLKKTVADSPMRDLVSVCSRLEAQGRSRDVGVEADRHVRGPAPWSGAAVADLRGAVEAGGLAEPVVERHRGEGRADHAGDHDAADRSDDARGQAAARDVFGR